MSAKTIIRAEFFNVDFLMYNGLEMLYLPSVCIWIFYENGQEIPFATAERAIGVQKDLFVL